MIKALILIDFINDIGLPDWKLAWKWYAKFIDENNIIWNTNEQIKSFRNNWDLIIFVKIWFKSDYSNQPKNSILFWKAHEFQIFKDWDIWDEFCSDLNILPEDIVILKTRISAFYNTNLDSILKNNNVSDLYFAGVSTDLAIESTVRDSHDRDYNTFVLEKCCAAWDINSHNNSIKVLSKIATIV